MDSVVGRRLSYWIARTLREERERAGVLKSSVAAVLGDDTTSNVDRIEKDDYGYGRDIDRTVWAYAYALGIDDPRELWVNALLLWLKIGAAPDFSEQDLPGMSFLRPIRDQARRQSPTPDELSEKLRATRRTRRGAR